MYGELVDGMLIHVTLETARSLLAQSCVLLDALAEHLVFEVAVGVNGAVWIKAGTLAACVIIRNCIVNTDIGRLSDIEQQAMVATLVGLLSSQRTAER